MLSLRKRELLYDTQLLCPLQIPHKVGSKSEAQPAFFIVQFYIYILEGPKYRHPVIVDLGCAFSVFAFFFLKIKYYGQGISRLGL